MKVVLSGHHHVHDPDLDVARPQGSGDYLALLIKSEAVFILNGREVKTQPNTLFIYKEGSPQYYKACGTPFVNDWFHFKMSEEEYAHVISLGVPFETPVHIEHIEFFSMLVNNINVEHYSANLHREETIDSYLRIFFNKLSETILAEPLRGIHNNRDKFHLLRAKIYNRPYLKWDIENLAHQICLSPYYFQRLYKQHFGVSCISDVIAARVLYAKQLLKTTNTSINGIAELCGYENSVHFMRQFKKHTGYTPNQYRSSAPEEPEPIGELDRSLPDIF